MSTPVCGELPRPDGYRGSGEPVWRCRGVMVSQTEPHNRAEDAVATVTLWGISGGEWALADAVRLARAILAAVDWTAVASDAGSAMGATPLAVDALGDRQPTQDRGVIEAQIRAVVCPDGTHRYLSTYCVDGKCPECRLTCMQCEGPCLCSCHVHPDGPREHTDSTGGR